VAEKMNFDQESRYYYKNKSASARKCLLINPPVIDTRELFMHNKFDPGPIGLLRVANYLYENNQYIKFFDFVPEKSRLNTIGLPSQKNLWKNRIEWKKVQVDRNKLKRLYYFGKSFDTFATSVGNIDPPDEIFIGSCMTYSCGAIRDLVTVLRRIFPKAKLVFGGFAATLLYEQIKEMGFDHVHVGPYEKADSYPPLYELMDTLPRRAVLRLTKGCPRNCSYCAVTDLEGNRIVNFGFEQLKDHFDHLYGLGFREFAFWDSNILFAAKDLKTFLDYLSDNNFDVLLDFHYGIEFTCLNEQTVELFDRDIIWRFIQVPLESTKRHLYEDRFHKGKDHLKNIDGLIGMFKRMRYELGFYVLMGMPEQTLDDILETIAYGHSLGCRSIIMPFSMIPMTEEYKKYSHLIEGKSLDDINPSLFPFSSGQMSFKDLQTVFHLFHGTKICKARAGFYYLQNVYNNKRKILIGQNRVVRKYKKLLKSAQLDFNSIH